MRSAADASSGWSDDRTKRAFPSPLTVVLVVLAAGITLGVVALSANAGWLAWDVRFAYLPAAEALLEGESPYPALDDPILEDQKGYVYPPQLLFVLVPLTPLPVGVAAALVTAGLLALLVLTLRVLQVRDVRCYAAALLWMPSVSGILLGNLSIPLAFAVAVAWRYRDEVRRPAAALGLGISAKLVMWPLLAWMVATGRLRASAWAVVVGVLVTLVAWTIIGFDGLTGYPDLLERLSEIQSERSYSIVGMAATAGLGDLVGRALTLLIGGTLLAGCGAYARRGDDQRSFTCAVAATLALSPIVWLHYLVVLLVPVAIARPRFSALWLLPVLLWVSPRPGYAEGAATFAPGIAAAILIGVLLWRPRSGRERVGVLAGSTG
jgi:alpha-1,2-mannosyltransferase